MRMSVVKLTTFLLCNAIRRDVTCEYIASVFFKTSGCCLRRLHVSSFNKGPRIFKNAKSGSALNTIALNDLKKGYAQFYRSNDWCVVSDKDSDLHNDIPHLDETLDKNSIGSLHNVTKAFGLERMGHLPDMSQTVYNLAPYVQKSRTLQNLVKLGINLTRVEKVKGMASLLLMSDFDKDILPYLRHLVRVGVAPDKLGFILSVNPMILTLCLEQLEQRVGYMISKEFTMCDVASMYTRAPIVVMMDPARLNKKWHYLKEAFNLADHEVRHVVLAFPKLLPWRTEKITDIRLTLTEFMGFEYLELKLMLLREPKLYTTNKHQMQKVFDYIHNTMLIPHSLIVKNPFSLRSRLHKLQERHLFLVHLGKAQYEPREENFVSLKTLLQCSDEIFCLDVAKSTEAEFRRFLKLL